MDDFTLVTEIYRGRLSVVWRAVCAATAQEVVVKGYPKVHLRDRHLLNVRKEVAFLQRFSNDGLHSVVSLLGVFEDAQHVCIVTEYCHGQDLLHQMDKSGGTMSERDVCQKVVYPLLKILDGLHKQGIVHRDLKAENVFFTKDDGLKLGDFGLALDMTCEIATTKVGTLDYMAPEIIRTPPPDRAIMQDLAAGKLGCYDEKVDIWSLGILVYELIVGKPPFEVEDMQETMKLILWSPVECFPPNMSVFCQHFITQALEKEPKNRPSAEKLLQHPWLCQNVGIRALAPLSSAPAPKCQLKTNNEARDTSPSWSPFPISAKSESTKLQPIAGSALKPSNRPKMCMPRQEATQAAKLSKYACRMDPKIAMCASSDGPAKFCEVDSGLSNKDSSRSGRFKFNPRNLTNRGYLWINTRFSKKLSENQELECGEKDKLYGESSPSSMLSIKERIKRLLPKKLRSKGSLN